MPHPPPRYFASPSSAQQYNFHWSGSANAMTECAFAWVWFVACRFGELLQQCVVLNDRLRAQRMPGRTLAVLEPCSRRGAALGTRDAIVVDIMRRLSLRISVARHARSLLLLAPLLVSGCMMAYPSRAHVGPPPPDLGGVSVTYPSKSGSLIHAWLTRGRPGAGAVILLHGVNENRTSMLGRARFLHAMGFTILAPDFRAHGESPGKRITFGARESLDAAAALGYVRSEAPGERVGVIGVSMGGAAALLGDGPIDANAFVLESVYPTIRQAVSDRLYTWLGPLGSVARLFTPLVIDVVGNDAGVSASELRPIDHIGHLHAPLLLIAGTDDPYTPIAEADSLFAHAPTPKTYWQVSGATHEDLHAFDPARYERVVGGFLEQALRSPATSTTSAMESCGSPH